MKQQLQLTVCYQSEITIAIGTLEQSPFGDASSRTVAGRSGWYRIFLRIHPELQSQLLFGRTARRASFDPGTFSRCFSGSSSEALPRAPLLWTFSSAQQFKPPENKAFSTNGAPHKQNTHLENAGRQRFRNHHKMKAIPTENYNMRSENR